ncbi:unnamed protein product [Urochloa decumbens]|uniref:Uncharacterized protein n=1 Tax=Urochloa decumbens TaxID=240449 RepID=A0ABC9C282_9POAL
MLESGFTEFKLDFEATKKLAIGGVVLSDEFAAGGHIWRVNCYPHGDEESNNGVYLSVFLELVSRYRNVKAIFQAFLMGRDGAPSSSHAALCVQVYPPEGFESWGFADFAKRSDLESDYVKDGSVTFMFGVIVLRDNDIDSPTAVPTCPITVPSSDTGDHLGRLLDGADGSDVSFSVSGETFPDHRAVLAARSPVFKAQLLGSMADANMSCITLHDIKPATFQILLRLKLVCAHRLWERVSAENVATVLGCAETHSCPELKKWCLEFFVVEKNFKIAVLTEGYFRLMQSFPSVIDEIRERVQA